MNSQKMIVTPAKTGAQILRNYLNGIDSGFRRNGKK